MNYQYLITEVTNRIGYITLNRTDKRNALNETVVKELIHAFQFMYNHDAVKVIQLRANGTVFSAGADLEYLQQLQKNTYEENVNDSSLLASLFKLIYTGPKAVVSVVQGHAIAGGCGLATVCDFCLSAPDAQFGYTEVKIGFVPAIVMIFLIRKLGETKARELMLTGKLVTAQEALAMGLINQIIPVPELQIGADALCKQLIQESSGDSISRIKTMLTNIRAMNLDDALHFAAHQNAETRSTNDCKKGISSFLHKQKINW